MSAPKKGTQTFQIRLEDFIVEELKKIAKAEGALSANALAANWIKEKATHFDRPGRPAQASKKPEFDFKELFFQEREANAELRKIISNLSEERKNFPTAEPAVVVKEGSASTALSRAASVRSVRPGVVRP